MIKHFQTCHNQFQFTSKINSNEIMKKTAIITGASGALGKVVTEHFLSNDYQVSAAGRSDNIYEGTTNLQYFPVDLSDQDAARDWVDKTVASYGKIDAALLIAGGFGMGTFENTDMNQVEKMIQINFYTAFNTIKPLLDQFKKQSSGGKIVMVGAKPVLETQAGLSTIAYTLSKTLIFKLSELINENGKNHKIQSAVIAPSIIDTPNNRDAMPNADFSKWVNPQELADMMLYFCSGKAKSLRNVVLSAFNEA